MTTKLSNPYPLFLDTHGNLAYGASIYVGEPNKDPRDFPITTYFDLALTTPAPQPLTTLGGLIVNDRDPSFIFMAEEDYSVMVLDANGVQVSYTASIATGEPQYQPLDSDLTAIAALATTAFGRNLLTLANAAALKSATGIPDCLPLAGGTMTANIGRSGAGAHLFYADPAYTSPRVFVTANGAADPTSLPGDIWLEKAA